MKSLIKVVAVAAVLAVPAISFAQSSQPLTRAEVKAELAQLEKAGYAPNDFANYPVNLQHAEVVLAGQQNGMTAYGPVENGTSQSGK